VAPDMRGYNLSDKPTSVEDYSTDALAKDVVGLMDHFGAEKAAIVGHDWGAGVAWALAHKYPERLTKLAVLQVPPAAAWRANLTLAQLLRSWYMLFFQLPHLPEWLIRRNNFKSLNRVFKDDVITTGSFTDDDIEMYKEALGQKSALTSAINYYRANAFRIIRGAKPKTSQESGSVRSGRVKVPTLFIFGERDPAILPQTVRDVAKYIDGPYSELRIPGSGHWVQNEAVEEVNSALIKFLRTG